MKSKKLLEKTLVELGAKLSDLREQKGFHTLKEFVEKYQLPEVQYWRMEKGKVNLTIKSLVKILSIHKMTLDDFFCMVYSKQQKVTR